MKFQTQVFLFILLLSATAFLLPQEARATISPTITISPAKFDLEIVPGQLQQTVIKITNQSEDPVPVKVVPMDWAPKDNIGGIDFGKSLPDRSAVEWISVSPSDLLLSPKESKTVSVTLSVPATISQGSYFSVVMFQASFPSNYFDTTTDTQAKIVPWIGSLIMLKYGDVFPLEENALTITKFQVPRFTTKDKVPALVEVKNNTNYHLAPEAEFELKSLRGPIKARVTTDETTILPGMSRIFQAEITKAPPLGLFNILAKVRIAGYQKIVSGRSLVLLTIQGILLVVGVVALLVFKYRHRKRIFAALKALAHPHSH
jgi:hypothetical protein